MTAAVLPMLGSAKLVAAKAFASLAFRLLLIAMLALALFNTYGAAGFTGPLGIGFHFEGWKPKAQRLQGTVDTFAQAQATALRLARQQRDQAEQRYRDLAERIDHDNEQAQATALDAADRYIAAHRVQCPAGGGATRATFTPAGSVAAGLPAGLPAPALVVVGEADVRACSAAAAYAVKAHDWAVGLDSARTGATGLK